MPTNRKWSLMKSEEVAKLPANTIKERDPERYKCIIQLLKEGTSHKAISKATGACMAVITKIMLADDELNKGIDALSSRAKKGAGHAIDRLNERMEADVNNEIAFKDLAVVAGILTDKVEKLSQSQAPQSLHVTQINVNEAVDINDIIQSLPKSAPQEQSQAIDVEDVTPENEAN